VIIDHIEQADKYAAIHTGIGQAFQYLQTTDLEMLNPGRYPIDGDRLFAIVETYETKPHDQGRWEAHQRYIDIQYVIAGSEKMGYAQVGDLELTHAYDPEKDIAWFAGDGSMVTVTAGSFVVFFPEDAHMPGLADEEPATVRKVVVKIACDADR
jgi:YhcH/YjgK/YiaL family protein